MAERIVADRSAGSYVDWACVLAGAVTAAAVSFLLLTFGSGIGLSMVSTPSFDGTTVYGGGMSTTVVVLLTALWTILVQVGSYAVGGYLAGRMRRPLGDANEGEVSFRDGAHGLLVWAVGVIVSALVAASVASSTARMAASVAGGAAQASTSVMDTAVDSLLRPGPGQQAPQQAQADTAQLRAELGRLMTKAVSAEGLTAADRDYLVQTVSRRTGVPAAEIETRLRDVTATARSATEKARKYGIVAAFLAAATLLVSAVAAWTGATKGGEHRQSGVVWRGLARRERSLT